MVVTKEEQKRIDDEMWKIKYSGGTYVLNLIALVIGSIFLLASIVMSRNKSEKREMSFLISLIPGIILLILFIVYSINIKKIPDKTEKGDDMTNAKKEYNGFRWGNGAISFGLLVISVVLFIKDYYLVPKKNI